MYSSPWQPWLQPGYGRLWRALCQMLPLWPPALRSIAMNKHLLQAPALILIALLVFVDPPLRGQTTGQLEGKNVSIRQTDYKGRSAIQLLATPSAVNASSYAVIKDATFRDGAIEVTVGKVTHKLAKDDCLAMQLDAPVTFRNRTRRAAHYIVVLAS